MQHLIVESLEDLENALSLYGEGYVYRGQNNHYLKDGKVSIPTSFERQGCIPPLMLKWSHYARSVIRAFSGAAYHDAGLELSQAILQHYGWRSFYVDLTKAPQVACWFAANIYEERRTIQMCENLDEEGVWLVCKEAGFKPKQGNAHVYVIDTLVLKSLNVHVHDLTLLAGEEGILRYSAQHACLAGHLKDYLPHQAIVTHLEVPCDILRQYYEAAGYDSVEKLFPSRDDDFIYSSLLDIPWIRFGIDTLFPTYRRGLDLPEYDTVYRKRLSADHVLYSETWIADDRLDSPLQSIPFYKMPEITYYANSADIGSLENVQRILNQFGALAIELDGLIHTPESAGRHEFEKGVYVHKIGEHLVSVDGLYVDHPGHIVSGFGVLQGWVYDASVTPWKRVNHERECPCNNDVRHVLQFSMLNRLEEALTNSDILEVKPLIYTHKDLAK